MKRERRRKRRETFSHLIVGFCCHPKNHQILEVQSNKMQNKQFIVLCVIRNRLMLLFLCFFSLFGEARLFFIRCGCIRLDAKCKLHNIEIPRFKNQQKNYTRTTASNKLNNNKKSQQNWNKPDATAKWLRLQATSNETQYDPIQYNISFVPYIQ